MSNFKDIKKINETLEGREYPVEIFVVDVDWYLDGNTACYNKDGVKYSVAGTEGIHTVGDCFLLTSYSEITGRITTIFNNSRRLSLDDLITNDEKV